MLPVALLRAGELTESDTFWQIRTGLVTLAEKAIPATDPFSWTALGESWTQNSWAFNVVLAGAYHVWGLPAVALLCATLIMGIGALVVHLARQLGGHPIGAGLALFVASPLLIGFLQARPQLIDYIAVLALVLVLQRLTHGSVRPLHAVAVVSAMSIVWVNLHAAVLLGVGILGACAGLLILRRRTRELGWWCAAATALSFLGAAANPRGFGLLSQTLGVRDASTGVVMEWQPFNPGDLQQLLMFVLGMLGLLLAVRRREVPFVAALTVAAAGSVVAMRLLPVLLLVALPLLASVKAPGWLSRYADSRQDLLRFGVTLFMAGWLAVAVPQLTHLGRPSPSIYPSASITDAIPAGCRLFNSYVLGGWVILERPDVPVSLDSRNDLYGVERVVTFESAVRGQGDLDEALSGAECVLVPLESGLAEALKDDRGWVEGAADDVAVLYVRG
ncbi:hypothetical protein [Georgenia soli]|nr:hypothetical protein [Georgenia soli]